MPITWRNIRGNSNAVSSDLLRGARESINTGFDSFNSALEKHKQGVTDRNTDEYLNRISQFTDPRELEAAIKSGQLQQFRSQLGSLIDQDAVRGMAGEQLDTLRKRAIQGGEFEDYQTDRSQRPVIAEFNKAIAEKRFGDADNLLEEYNLLGEGKLSQQLADARYQQDERAYQDVLRDRETIKFGQSQEQYAQNQKAYENQETIRKLGELAQQEVTNFTDSYIQDIEKGGDDKELFELAKRYKIPLVRDENGNVIDIDYDNAEPFRLKTLNRIASRKGLGEIDSESLSEAKLSLRDRLRKAEVNGRKLTGAELDSLTSNFERRIGSRGSLANADQAKIDAMQAQLDQGIKNNPFHINKDLDTEKAARDIVMEFMDKEEGDTGELDSSAVNSIVGIMNKGVSIPVRQSNGTFKDEKIVPSPALLQMAILRVGEDRLLNVSDIDGDNIEEALKDLIKNDAGTREKLEEYKQYLEDSSKVSAQGFARYLPNHRTSEDSALKELRRVISDLPNRR